MMISNQIHANSPETLSDKEQSRIVKHNMEASKALTPFERAIEAATELLEYKVIISHGSIEIEGEKKFHRVQDFIDWVKDKEEESFGIESDS